MPRGVVERRRLELEDVVLGSVCQTKPAAPDPDRATAWQDGAKAKHRAVHPESERQSQRHEHREPVAPHGGAPQTEAPTKAQIHGLALTAYETRLPRLQ
jgi:hypothetical protein